MATLRAESVLEPLLVELIGSLAEGTGPIGPEPRQWRPLESRR